jgi:hypothetical protein
MIHSFEIYLELVYMKVGGLLELVKSGGGNHGSY